MKATDIFFADSNFDMYCAKAHDVFCIDEPVPRASSWPDVQVLFEQWLVQPYANGLDDGEESLEIGLSPRDYVGSLDRQQLAQEILNQAWNDYIGEEDPRWYAWPRLLIGQGITDWIGYVCELAVGQIDFHHEWRREYPKDESEEEIEYSDLSPMEQTIYKAPCMALYLLVMVDDPRSIPGLIAFCEDELLDEIDQSHLWVDAVKRFGESVVPEVLRVLRRTQSPAVRFELAGVLSDYPNHAEAFSTLIDLFRSAADERGFYAGLLGQLHRPELIPVLENSRYWPEHGIWDRGVIERAIDALGGKALFSEAILHTRITLDMDLQLLFQLDLLYWKAEEGSPLDVDFAEIERLEKMVDQQSQNPTGRILHRMTNCARGLLHFLGSAPVELLYKRVVGLLELPEPPSEFQFATALHQAGAADIGAEHPVVTLDEHHRAVSPMVGNADRVEQLRTLLNPPERPLRMGEIMAAAMYRLEVLWNTAELHLIHTWNQATRNVPEAVGGTTMQELVRNAESAEHLHFMIVKELELENTSEAKKWKQWCSDVWDNTTRWEMNGWRPTELNRAGSLRAVGRNDLCPCGSGKKYKKCCGLTQ